MAERGGECETAAAKSPPHDLSVQLEFPCGCLPWCRQDLAAAQGMGFADFLRRHFGVLLSHSRQTALFLVVPCILEAGGLPIAAHWKVYLPVMGFAFVTMVSAFIAAEKRGKMNAVATRAVGLILIGQLLLGESPHMLWFQANAPSPGGAETAKNIYRSAISICPNVSCSVLICTGRVRDGPRSTDRKHYL